MIVPTLKRIVVAYDGSALAREAFAYAVEIAARAQLPILAVQTIEPIVPSPPMDVPMDPLTVPQPLPADLARPKSDAAARRELDELRGFAIDVDVEIHTRVLHGPLRDALREAADPTDLIAVGLKGRFADAGLGSETAWLVEHGPCPLLIATGPLLEIARVMVVFDGSPQSERAVAWAEACAARARWPMAVLAVAGHGLSTEAALQRAQELAGDAPVISYEHDGQSEQAQIEDACRHTTHSILVMGAFPDSWLHRLLFGGTTAHVLNHVQVPVVLVR